MNRSGDVKIKISKTVNFGRGLSGRRANVFYSVYDTLGTGSFSRTNSGVYELNSASGIYGTELAVSQSFSGSIIWEVTASNGSVVFASDEIITDSKVTRHFTAGQWEIDRASSQMIFYTEDNVTEIARFDLTDESGNGSVESVFKRARVTED